MTCDDCGAVGYPPRPFCTVCRSERHSWEHSAGLGTVYSYTVVQRAPYPGAPVPSFPAIVELDEGPAMLSRLVECTGDEIVIGMPVEVVFERLGATAAVPLFRPARGTRAIR